MQKRLHFFLFLLFFILIERAADAQVYDQTTAYQQINQTPQTFTFNFTGIPAFGVGTATLIVYYDGDFGATSEIVTAYGPGGTVLGQTTSDPNGTDCAGEDTTAMSFDASSLIPYGASVNFTLTTSPNVDYFCTSNQLKVRLIINYCVLFDPLAIAAIDISTNEVCPSGLVTLGGNPSTASFSGPGVSGNTFDPSMLAQGSYTVTMTATDNFGCTSTDDTTIRVLSAPTAIVPPACSTFNGTLNATSGVAYSRWYSDAALTNLLSSGQGLTLNSITNDTTFYLSYLSPSYHFQGDTFTVENFAIVDHDGITGDDRGGIAVTDDHVYIVGDDFTARYDLDLTNGVQLQGMDGLFTDLSTNQLYTLYNTNDGTAQPVFQNSDQPVFNAVRRLNDDLTFANDSVVLDRTFSLNQNYNGNVMFSGAGMLLIYSGDDEHVYKIDLFTGLTEDLGQTNLDFYYSENWASWGIAEYDGTNYSVLYRSDIDANIHRKVLPDGPNTVVSNFTDMSDMASIAYSSTNDRWYFHFEGGSQLNGNSETLGYADATGDTTYVGLAQSCARPIRIVIDTTFDFTLSPVKATGNCSGVTALMGSGIMVNGQPATGTFSYQWLANNVPVTNGGAFNGATTDTLNISDTTGLTGTTFMLVATNTCGTSDTTEGYVVTDMIGNTWSGTTDNDWDDANNWSCGEVPTATTLAIIPNVSNHPVINIPNAICGGLEIHQNMDVTFAGTTNQLEIRGDVYGAGELNGQNGRVVLNGANQQDLYNVAFDDVQITGGGKKVFHVSTTILGELALNNGVIEIYDTMYLHHPDQQTGGDASSFIVTNGDATIVGMDMGIGGITAPVTYHIGINENSYTPVTIQNEGVLDMFAVGVIPHVYNDGDGTNPAQTSSPVVDRTWMISELTPGGSFATITPQWNAADEISGFDNSHVYVAHYMNNTWTSDYDSAVFAPAANGSDPYTATTDSVTSFSPFAVASAGQFPLTIKLLDISAVNAGPRNRVNWKSQTESKSDAYELERSTDGKAFSRIATIVANGNASTYSHWDESPVKGTNYYRVKMTEANGKYAYSKVVSAVVAGNNNFSIEAFPNPVKNTVSINVNGTVAGKGNVTVSDITGRVIAISNVENNMADINMSSLANGVYLINYTDDVRNETIKVNKQ